jgi:hypothetical protein
MSDAALIPLGQALSKRVLLSPVQQSYYNAFALGRWPWLTKKHNKLWVDLVGFRAWCLETGKPLGSQQLANLNAVIQQLTKDREAASA